MIDMTLRHTEGFAAAGTSRVRASVPAAAACGTTGFGAYPASTRSFAGIAASPLATVAIDWHTNEQKSMNPVDLHHPRPPELGP